MASVTPTWADLELFWAVARGGSLSAAGRALGVEQSTVSRRLAALEERLGARLFVRTREGVVLTALGERWLEPAEAAERGVMEARAATRLHAADQVAGHVRIATLLSVADGVLARALPELLARHPKLSVSLLASPKVMDLTRLEAELAIRLMRPTAGDLVSRVLLRDRMCPWATRAVRDALEGEPPQRWPWIGWAEARLGHPGVQAWMAQHGVSPRVRCLSPTTMIAAAQAGAGVAMLGRQFGVRFEGLVPLRCEALEGWEVVLWLVAHQDVRRTPAVAAVWDWLLEGAQETMRVNS